MDVYALTNLHNTMLKNMVGLKVNLHCVEGSLWIADMLSLVGIRYRDFQHSQVL